MTTQYNKGVLELCALSMLEYEDQNGCAAAKECDRADVTDSSIYPMLRRLKQEEYVSSYVEEVYGRLRRKNYVITTKGEKFLRQLVSKYFCDDSLSHCSETT